jgi:HCOMODA/2-hydroxy-3-carboxy-muconic semialdehyde decarboxylase
MRGHGSVVAGHRIQEVVFAAVYMELNARLQMQAASLGPVRYLSEGEVRLARTMLLGPLATERAWTFWRRRIGLEG